MKAIKSRLTYANVVSTVVVFLLLGGASAFAANQLGKNSVGTKQIKKNAVTAAKIRKNAVTKVKIKNGSINASKIIDGSISGADLDLASTPFGRVVARFRAAAVVNLPSASLTPYPLPDATFTQGADELNWFAGALDGTFSPTCTAPRSMRAYVLQDSKNPLEPSSENVVGVGVLTDATGATPSARLEIGSFIGFGSRFEPGVAATHTLTLLVSVECKSGSGATAAAAAIDVVGTR